MEKVDGKQAYVTHVFQKVYKDKSWGGSRKSRFQNFKENRHVNVIRFSVLNTGRLYPFIKYFGYLFLLEAESNAGP